MLRARLEADRLDDQFVGLVRQKQEAQADLAALVQQPVTLLAEASDELGLTDVPTQLDELIVLAERCNPKLKGLAWEVQRDRQKHRLACLQKYPDLQVGLNWGLVSDDRNVISPVANGHDQINFNVGTTLPIWRDKINAGVREAANRTSSTAKRLDAERDALYGKLRRLLGASRCFHGAASDLPETDHSANGRHTETLRCRLPRQANRLFQSDRNLSRTADVRDSASKDRCVTGRNGRADRTRRRLSAVVVLRPLDL